MFAGMSWTRQKAARALFLRHSFDLLINPHGAKSLFTKMFHAAFHVL